MRIRRFMITLGVSAVVFTGCKSITTPVSEPKNTETLDEISKEEENNNLPIENNEDEKESQEEQQAAEIDYLADFNILLNDTNTTPKILFQYISKNLSSLSADAISTALTKTEDMQISYLTKLENKYMDVDIQNSFLNASIDFNNLDSITDIKLKELLVETKETGYQVETAEGFYYPVINYEIYKDYIQNANADIKEYFEIMMVESNNRFAKDAALLISYDEVLNRGLRTEGFLTSYKDSIKYINILSLYNRYETIALYGLNNTPLFHYESKKMDETAKLSYQNFVDKNKDSELGKILAEFISLSSENNDILNDKLEGFRNSVSESSEKKLQELNPYSVAGIDNPIEFEKMFQLLQEYVKNNEKEFVASYIAYPISVTINNVKTTIKTEAEFVSNYDEIFNESVKNAFLNQNVKECFVNYKGVMVGDGQLWFSMIEGTTHKYSIYGINN